MECGVWVHFNYCTQAERDCADDQQNEETKVVQELTSHSEHAENRWMLFCYCYYMFFDNDSHKLVEWLMIHWSFECSW